MRISGWSSDVCSSDLEAAKRIVSDVWKQATSGVRPSTDMLTNWATAVEGTAAAPEFKAAMGALQDVQGVLRESPETQAAYVPGLRATLTAGAATPEDQARIVPVERAHEASNKQRDTYPLPWLASATHPPSAPIHAPKSHMLGK